MSESGELLNFPQHGHNRGPTLFAAGELVELLPLRCADLEQRRAALDEAFERFAQAHPAIGDDDAQGRAAEFVRQLRAFQKRVDEARIEQKSSYLAAERAIEAWFKRFVASVIAARTEVEARMRVYADAIERKRRETAAAEARRLGDLARAAEAAMRKDLQPETIDTALDAARAAREARDLAESKPAEFARVRGDFGGVATLAEHWSYEVEDESKVPLLYRSVDDKKVRRAINDGIRAIPGLRIFADNRMVVR